MATGSLPGQGKKEVVFHGLDTETQKGKAVLIGTPYTYCLFPKSFRECIEFLEDHKHYLCWNADYDVQAILKFLKKDQLLRLYLFTSIDWEPGYKIRYVKSKFASISYKGKTIINIFDLQQFYHMKLETAARKILGEGKNDIPEEWYSEMASCLRDSRKSQVIKYCQKDALLVEKIGDVTKSKFEQIGLSFDRPVSNASLSVQRFSQSMRHSIPREFNEIARETYRGGRMECLKLGYFPEAWLPDIHSAYPSAIADLAAPPDVWLRFGENEKPRKDSSYFFVDCSIKIPKDTYVNPIPIIPETPGSKVLFYPFGQWRQWIDQETYRLLLKRDWIAKIHGGIEGIASDAPKPFGEIRALFKERQKNPNLAYAIKIVLNALYGKFAEVIIKRLELDVLEAGDMLADEDRRGDVEYLDGILYRTWEQWTKRTNFVFASTITAKIRARLFNEIPWENCIYSATDGVALLKPEIRGKIGNKLGEWSEPERITDLIVVGSGMYSYIDSKGERQTKFRGFNSSLDLAKILDTKKKIVDIRVKRNVSLSQAARQHRWSEFNEIQETSRFLDVNFDRKRIWEKERRASDLLKTRFDSESFGWYD